MSSKNDTAPNIPPKKTYGSRSTEVFFRADQGEYTFKEQKMKVENRRKGIINLLLAEKGPISGGDLSNKFGVSRQIIVQDIAMLRARGFDITPTHNGYVIRSSPLVERVFKLRHKSEETEDELSLIISLGATVADVYISHDVYGKVSANLSISTPADLKRFVESLQSGESAELMNITGGFHYHTVRAETDEILDKVEEALKARGYLV
jgi:transcriptional regulator of NAD metabolism